MNFFKKICTVSVAILAQAIAFAQAPAIDWQTCMGGSGYDQVTSLTQVDDGGYVAAVGSFNFRVVKLSPNGVVEWDKNYGGPAEDVAYCIKNIPDKGYVITGYTKSIGGDVFGNHGGSDMWVLRIDQFGNLLWRKCFGGGGDEQGRYISLKPTGGFIIAGLTTSYDGDVTGRTKKTPGPDCDVWVVNIDDTGKILWQKTFGGSLSDAANCVRPTSDNGYIVAGTTFSRDGDVSHYHYSPDTTSDAWVIKLNIAGDSLWETALGGSADDVANSVQQCLDGGYIMAGISNSVDGDVTGNHGDDDGWVVKLDNWGKMEWQRSIGGNNGDGIYEVDVTADGWYIVAGVESSGNIKGAHGGYDFWITKLVYNGDIFWQKCMGGSDHDYGACMTRAKDKSYLMGGWTMSNDGDVSGNHGGHYDTWVVKLDPDTTKVPPLDINAVSNGNITVYPTYTNNIVQIENASNSRYILSDIAGKRIMEGTITDSRSQLSLGQISPGSYFLQLFNSADTKAYRLVKY